MVDVLPSGAQTLLPSDSISTELDTKNPLIHEAELASTNGSTDGATDGDSKSTAPSEDTTDDLKTPTAPKNITSDLDISKEPEPIATTEEPSTSETPEAKESTKEPTNDVEESKTDQPAQEPIPEGEGKQDEKPEENTTPSGSTTPTPASLIADLQKQLLDLSSKFEKLATDVKKKEEEEEEEEDKKVEDKDLSLEIKRLPMSKYLPRKSFKAEELRKNVIVAYYKKVPTPKIEEALPHGESKDSASEPKPAEEQGTKDAAGPEMPQRIQINSRILLDELQTIGATTVLTKPTVMLPPFKLLVIKRDEIERIINQKEKLRQEAETVDESAIGPKTKQETDKEKESKAEETLIKHLRHLLSFIDEELKPIFEFRAQLANGTITKIVFDDLWHLFNPGDMLFKAIKKGTNQDIPDVVRVHCVTGGREKVRNDGRKANTYDPDSRENGADAYGRLKLSLDCHYTEFDGQHFGPQLDIIQIQPYNGEREITHLDAYPARFHKDYEAILQRLRARGKRFHELSAIAHKNYDGLTISEPEEVQGEVVIDFKTGYEYEELDKKLNLGHIPSSDPGTTDMLEVVPCSVEGCTGCTYSYFDREFDWSRCDEYKEKFSTRLRLLDPEKEDIPESYLELLPRAVVGYVFRSRSWSLLDIDCVHDIDDTHTRRKRGFDQLVIDTGHKDLLLALVQNHASGKHLADEDFRLERAETTSTMDLVRGKGRGLIILLHGAPGVGKTLTAETIAAYTGRPLYPITCGDIGMEPTEIEKSLDHHFKLAHKWGCVLLLDEADVFLARRTRGDVQRNGQVSVFLRVLEYYSGILFLTTNQVGVFDEAFKSRIHISLYYPTLSLKSTEELWKNHLNRIEEQNASRHVPIVFDREDILNFAIKHFEQRRESKSVWNGRQIRNAFQTAIALAEYDRAKKLRSKNISEDQAMSSKKYQKATLTKGHFKKVGKASEDFDDYMRHVRHGKHEADQAHADELRVDDWYQGISERPMLFRNKLQSSMGDISGRKGGGLGTPFRDSPMSARNGDFRSPGGDRDDYDDKRGGSKQRGRGTTTSKKKDYSSEDSSNSSDDSD